MHFHVHTSLSAVLLSCLVLIIETQGEAPINGNTVKDRDYSTSAYDLRKLVRHEQKLIQHLIDYKEAIERKLKLLYWYLDDYKASILGPVVNTVLIDQNENLYNLDALEEATVKNPIMSYRLISRFVEILTEIERSVTDEPEKDFTTKMGDMRAELQFPKQEHVNGSQMALIRLYHTYKIPLADFEAGHIQGAPENTSGLEAMDFYQIGFQARRFQLFSTAIEFWNKAFEMGKLESALDESLMSKIESTLNEAILEHDKRLASGIFEGTMNPYHFVELLYRTYHPNFKTRFEAQLDMSQPENSRILTDTFQRLCRGELIKPPNKTLEAMNCYLLKPHPFFQIQPLKVEFYSTNPPVLQIYDVLTEAEMEKIRNEAVEDLEPSRVVRSTENTSSKQSLLRTSTNTWIYDQGAGNPFEFVGKRIELITRLKVTSAKNSSAEMLQIANYGPGAFYTVHDDALHEPGRSLDEFELKQGDRISTFMFYLSEVQSGGGTAFPKLGVAVKPVKGSAVWWFNLHTDLSINRDMLHGGCPVLYSNKWVANKWIRAYDQMLIRQCPLVQSNDVFL